MKMNCLCLVAILAIPSVTSAQIKQWTDENGVMHYGNTPGSGNVGTERRGTLERKNPGETNSRIERSHAGLALGDNAASYRTRPGWKSLGIDQFGGEVLRAPPSANMTKIEAMFVDGRLSLIGITYKDFVLNGWEGAVKSTEQKYGPPNTDHFSKASWRDNETLLNLKKDYRGGIEVMIADTESMQRYNRRRGESAPKF